MTAVVVTRGIAMEDALLAYNAGRVDALEGRRDADLAEHPETGADYRRGFLDARIEVVSMHAELRKLLGHEG
ncbi:MULTISPECIES: hypothetical protein [Catenuloplanes]|uniref:Uncharacterized protein n=1 Tax=Catenuloplanes niger TaxID=587534 RepID=A0AAE4CY29_9ACTN|nr:hypothetical protein [Catenuloplanes niger]MDR7327223.1 hypothetical protein [Catenuloplanes niger]